MKNVYLLLISVNLFAAATAQTPQLGKNSIKEIIAAMTLEEKVKLLVGNGFKLPGMTPPGGPVCRVLQKCGTRKRQEITG